MSDEMHEASAKLLNTLKRHQPHKIRAYTSDDDHRDVAVPGGRKKWSQVVAAIEARAWSYVVLLDRSGAELATVQNTDPATELQDLGPGSRSAGEYQLAVRIAELMLKGQREALQWRDEETKALLKAQGDVVREMVNGMKALSDVWSENAEVSAEVAAAAAVKEAGGADGQLKQLMEALPVIMQAMPMLRALLSGGQAPPTVPPNGARKG